MEHFGVVFKLDLTEETRTQFARGGGNFLLPHTGYAYACNYLETNRTYMATVYINVTDGRTT